MSEERGANSLGNLKNVKRHVTNGKVKTENSPRRTLGVTKFATLQRQREIRK